MTRWAEGDSSCMTGGTVVWLSVDWQINDYVAGYHDGALLFGKVMREWILSQKNQGKTLDVPLSDNPFGNASFHGAYDDWKKNAYNEIF